MTALSSVFQGNYTGIAEIDYGQFVDRGDPVDYDFSTGDFTHDSTWRDFDLSSILPSNAVAVVMRVYIRNTVVGEQVFLRKNGNTNARAVSVATAQVASANIETTMIVPCDSSQVVEYYSTSGGTWTVCSMVVIGWYTEKTTTGGWLDSPLEFGDNDEMTNPSQPCFFASLTSSLTNVTGDGTVYNFNTDVWTEVYDQGSNFASGVFTAPVDGKYRFTFTVRYEEIAAAHTNYFIGFVSSNLTVYPDQCDIGNVTAATGTGSYRGNYTLDLEMDASDTFYVTILVANGTKVIDVNAAITCISGALIC